MSRIGLCFAAVALMLVWGVEGKRKPSLRKGGYSASTAAAAQAEGSGPIVVQLRRLPATHVEGILSQDASFYVGNMSVGTPPQHMEVLFDTASGHVLLPHKACKSAACLEHHHYSPWASSTALDVNANGEAVQKEHRVAEGKVNRSFAHIEFTQSDLGAGGANGVLVREHICMSACKKGRTACADLSLFAATEEDYKPFGAMPADGIVGLGLEGLAVGALSSFFPRLLDGSQDMLPEFGLALGPEGGEIIFGGRSQSANLASELEWFPVSHPEDGFWQMEILSVRLGGKVVDACEGGCRGIIDSAASHLGVQANRVEGMKATVTESMSTGGFGCRGPVLEFELKTAGFALKLEVDDYTSDRCEPEFGSLDLKEPEFKGVYSFGTNMLRRYYAAFDWSKHRIGFAPNAGPGTLRMDAAASSAGSEITI